MRKFIFRVLAFLSAVPVLIVTWPWIEYYLVRTVIVLVMMITAIVTIHRIRVKQRRRNIERYYMAKPVGQIYHPTISVKKYR